MQRIDPLRRAWPLHDVAASRAIEEAAMAVLPPHTLMRRAGAAIARCALAVAPHAEIVWVAAGPGNNGGDGLEAALHLHRAGKRVRVSLLGDAERLPPDAADALQRARDAGVSISPSLDACRGDEDLMLDGLLGLGASRAPQGELAAAIALLATARGEVLAIDLPSGLHPETGQPLGDGAVRATHTLALLSLKPGLYTAIGRDHAGTVWLDLLGTDANARPATALLSGGPETAHAAARRHAQHKGSFGDVHVVGGAATMTGAALLAGRAALAAGAGRVYVALLDGDALTHDIIRPELMFRPGWWQREPKQLAAGITLCGCGGGEAVHGALPALLAHAGRLVLDADALNAVAADPALQRRLIDREGTGRASVLTPHPLEAARLLGISTPEVQADRLAAARRLAQRYRSVVVLKGSGSVIAAPGGSLHVNPTGNAALATAGSGDVLGGWLAGLWAGLHHDGEPAAVAATVQAVFRHGWAADVHAGRQPNRPLRAGDLIERLHELG